MNSSGELDFSKAEGYDEDLVRANLNKVKHEKNTKILKPAKIKEVVEIQPTNFITKNNFNLGAKVNKLNEKKKIEILKANRKLYKKKEDKQEIK